MARDPDDDALSWGDESDPTYAEWYKAPVRSRADAAIDDDADDAGDVVGDERGGDKHAGDELSGGVALARAGLTRDDDASSEAEKSGTRSGTASEDAFAASTGAPAWSRSVTPDSRIGRANEAAVGRARTAQAEAADDAAADDELSDAEKASEQLSSAALIGFGILGGIFLLYTVGWLVVFLRTQLAPNGLAEIVQDVQGILAVAAPALWFIVTLLLAARRRVSVRITWLLVGVFVLVPWPFITGN